jgi:tetratricopeptide (TPR) repeat protein
MKRTVPLILTIVIGLAIVVGLTHWDDNRRANTETEASEEPLYVSGHTARRLSLAFNGLAADWYWIRSLQYVGRKIVKYQDTHEGRFDLKSLASLDLRGLYSLLQVSTTLDPQFMAPYEYGSVILPEINQDQAIALLNYGIANNPNSWRLHQHLGYIYWQKGDYQTASDVYAAGAKLPDAPPWMAAMSARMKAEGGSRDAAREMYQHLYDASSDNAVREMVTKQVMRLDSLDQRDVIQRILKDYASRSGRCASSWQDVDGPLRSARLQIDAVGAPVDPSGAPYRLVKNGCDVDLNENSAVPKR